MVNRQTLDILQLCAAGKDEERLVATGASESNIAGQAIAHEEHAAGRNFPMAFPECMLIEGATDRLLPVAKEVSIVGPGAFASILVEASGKQPITLGKPGRELGDLLVEHYQIVQPSRVLMIGDMLAQDVSFGRQCGFQTLLVLSGGCSKEELLAETDPQRIPDYYADSVADVAQMLGEAPKSRV